MAIGSKTGGRKKGTPNKRNTEVQELLTSLGCDPFAGMVFVAQKAVALGDHSLAMSAYKELAKYVAPQLKAVEMTGADGEPLGAGFNPVAAAAEFSKAILESKNNENIHEDDYEE